MTTPSTPASAEPTEADCERAGKLARLACCHCKASDQSALIADAIADARAAGHAAGRAEAVADMAKTIRERFGTPAAQPAKETT
jgi:hypothetical protein